MQFSKTSKSSNFIFCITSKKPTQISSRVWKIFLFAKKYFRDRSMSHDSILSRFILRILDRPIPFRVVCRYLGVCEVHLLSYFPIPLKDNTVQKLLLSSLMFATVWYEELLWYKTLSAPSFSHYWKYLIGSPYRLGSKFCVNKTSQFSKRYSAQMEAAMKDKR